MKWITSLILVLIIYTSCSEPTKPDGYEKLLTIKDYNYCANRYFFIDTYYKDRFESGYSKNLQIFSFENGKDIVKLEVFVSTNITDADAIRGAAVLDPTDSVWQGYDNYFSITDITGEAESGYFKAIYDSLYSFDPYRGFFSIDHSIESNQTLAIKYTLDNGQKIGKLNQNTDSILLKLIKPKRQQPWDYPDTWPLMMKNVYVFGDTIASYNDYNIEIKDYIRDSNQDNSGRSYLSLLGLDISDQSGTLVENGEGQFDKNPYIFDKIKSVLIFPGLYPFNPLPQSRFQLDDRDKADMYFTTNISYIQEQSRFQISLLVKG